MKEKRNNGAMAFAAVVILLLVPMTAYVAGYFLRCSISTAYSHSHYPSHNGGLPGISRAYPTKFEAQIFRPAARIESTLTGQEVDVTYPILLEYIPTGWDERWNDFHCAPP